MSILDKYPWPWQPMRHGPECTAYDANGTLVAELGDGEHGREDLHRLILAAPELLASLKAYVDPRARGDSRPSEMERKARVLIDRIENGE